MNFKKNLYFDSNSYYPPNQKIIQKIFAEVSDSLGYMPLNPSSVHAAGQFASKILEDTRDFVLGLLTSVDLEERPDEFNSQGEIARFLDKNRGFCSFFDLIFCATSTEANNLAIENAFLFLGVDLFLCSGAEHASVLEKFLSLEKKGAKVKILEVDEFSRIKEDELLEILKENQDKRIFLSLIYVNNETGVQNDLENLIKKSRAIHSNLLVHSDFSQAVGKIAKINISKMNLDFVSFCGYKFGALNGSACLIFNKKFGLKPVMIGGGQESFKRAGTENIVSIYSLHKVLEEIYDSGWEVFRQKYNKLMDLRDYFEEKLKNLLLKLGKFEDLKIFGKCSQVSRPVPTSYFAVKGVKAKKTIIFLDNSGVCVGSGSACSAGLDVESSVLKAMKTEKEFAECAIRISFSEENSISDVDFLIERLEALYSK